MLSGSEVTRLWPYGGSGSQYGSFAGKTAQPIEAGAQFSSDSVSGETVSGEGISGDGVSG